MKKLILISMLFLTANIVNAQNALKAKIEFEEAELAYSENRYKEALEKLTKTEELIAKWAPNIAFLKIQVLDKICDYEDIKNPYITPLAKEIKSYIDFANANPDAVVLDKFKTVVQIEKILNYLLESEKWKKMEEFVAGQNAFKSSLYPVAMGHFMKAANKNNPEAMFKIGIMHFWGDGGAKNYPEAMIWLKKGAEKNHADAMCYMGNMYNWGDGVDENYAEALIWYHKAVDNGSTGALISIGDIYKYGGSGVNEDLSEAMSWYKKGAEKGSANAMYKIGEMYEEGNGVPKSYLDAFSWYSKAAEKNHYNSMKKLSDFYHQGLGIEKNINLAIKWLEKAIEVNKK